MLSVHGSCDCAIKRHEIPSETIIQKDIKYFAITTIWQNKFGTTMPNV